MGLRAEAEKDLGNILEDSLTGFGFAITVTDPAGTSANLTGFSNDIAEAIDPETGMVVSGRTAWVNLRISSLTAKGLGLPVSISDESIKPWLIEFDDINGNPFKFKVSDSRPDRTIGLVTCMLELFE